MINSKDYKIKFKEEYALVKKRIESLELTIKTHKYNPDEYKIPCPLGFLETQLHSLKGYRSILELRAEIEDIKII